MSGRASEQERRRKLLELQEAQRRADRRRGAGIVAAAAALAVVLIAVTAVVVVREARREQQLAAEAARPIEGVQEFADLTQNHVEGPVEYPQTPSVGGDHAGIWLNCGTYAEPVDATQATHSLEHGAVWVGYEPQLPAEQVQALQDLVAGNAYVLLSPVEGVASPVVASAWGVQLAVDDASDPRLATFLQKYQQGEGTPEPGAPCTGGVGTPS